MNVKQNTYFKDTLSCFLRKLIICIGIIYKSIKTYLSVVIFLTDIKILKYVLNMQIAQMSQ